MSGGTPDFARPQISLSSKFLVPLLPWHVRGLGILSRYKLILEKTS